VEFTILRPNNFFQNDLGMLDAIRAGVYPFPSGDIGMHRVDVRDIAEAAAIALTESGHSAKRYSLVGPRSWTGEEIAAALAQHLGKPVTYTGGDLKAWAEQMRPYMPGWLLRDLELMCLHFIHHGLLATQEEISGLTKLLGHAPRSYEDFIQEVLPK
jgi:uncharacterized protein YbjT (DUF2867 family)